MSKSRASQEELYQGLRAAVHDMNGSSNQEMPMLLLRLRRTFRWTHEPEATHERVRHGCEIKLSSIRIWLYESAKETFLWKDKACAFPGMGFAPRGAKVLRSATTRIGANFDAEYCDARRSVLSKICVLR
jgi:hypothetical protein